MNRLFFIFSFLAVLVFSTGIAFGQDQSLQRVKNAKKLVLGLDDTFAPMGFRDKNGNIVGFDIDLAKEVAKRLSVELEIKPVDWSSAILSLNKGDIDVLWNGLTISPNRQKQINFSKPYLKNRLIAVVLKSSGIKTKDDLIGKIVGVQVGSNDEALQKDPVSRNIKDIRKYDVNVNAFLDLQAKRIDAVIVDEVAAQYYITDKKVNFTVLKDSPLTEETYGVGFRKKDIALQKEIDKILDDMKRDGTAEKISKRWFSEDIVLRQ